MHKWNMFDEPIAARLRDDDELNVVQNNKTMLYHEPSGVTALIMDVWKVEPIKEYPESIHEDRYIRYTTEHAIKEDFSVDLDDEGWLWYDEMKQEVV